MGKLGERNDVVLVDLNHEMGYRGTTTTLLTLCVTMPGSRMECRARSFS
ncbi:hypothetical protein [Arthrobacter sp. 2MCAF14]